MTDDLDGKIKDISIGKDELLEAIEQEEKRFRKIY